MIVPEARKHILEKTDAKIVELEEQYREGLITENENYQQTVELWNDGDGQRDRCGQDDA